VARWPGGMSSIVCPMRTEAHAEPSLRRLVWWTTAGLAVGLAAIVLWVPTDEFQGVVQRIFYVHVPAAWAAYMAFTIVFWASIGYLWKRSRRWDLLARAAAEAGLLFTAVNLLTGMLWGRPIWGTYWAWDPRLTSTFVMALIYLGYLVFRAMATDQEQGARIAAVVGILGAIEIPIVHFSVLLWRAQHPMPAVLGPGGPQLPGEMLVTLMLMATVFTLLLGLMIRMRLRVGRLEAQLLELELRDPEPDPLTVR
jgi:heme exporter protein C